MGQGGQIREYQSGMIAAPELDGGTTVKLPRRQFLNLAAAAAALTAPRVAAALDFPARPVHLLIGFNAGGTPDVIARLLGQSLSERMGQNFIVENRPGAGGDIATEAVLRAPADGYTLLLLGSPNFINSSLRPNPNFNLLRDIKPVASIGGNPFVMVVNPSFPAKSVGEFIAYAKAHPGKINMTSTGTGNLTHFSGELFKMLAGVDIVHVPAHGEMEAQSDLMADRAQVMFDPMVSTIGQIKAGKLRALAVTSSAPVDMLPGVPTVGEFVPGYLVDARLGIGAPKETPGGVVDYLNKKINAGLGDPAIKVRYTELGFLPSAMTPPQFGAFMVEEVEKWAKVVKFAGVTLQ
jgi:tripartite-type tricarboxylate transporter receptor subunit TctC